MAGNIFINYRREESGHVAGRLHDSLAPKFGRNKLFMDVDNIPVGRDFEDYLNSQVAACDAMLAVIGPNWLTAKDETGQRRLDNSEDFVAIEIAAALARNIPVVPVLVDGARMPKASELPDSLKPLARRQAIQVRHTNFNSDAETLIKRLHEALGYESPQRRWRMQAIGVAAIGALFLLGLAGYKFFNSGRAEVEESSRSVQQQAELKWEEERRAIEAEASRKVEQAEQQRLAAVQAVERERQARAAAEADAKRKTDEAERLRAAQAEQERQARTAAEREARRVAALGQQPTMGREFGFDIADLTGELRKKQNISDAVSGVLITGAPIALNYFVGTVIAEIDNVSILSVIEVQQRIEKLRNDGKSGAQLSIYTPDGRPAYAGFRFF